MQDGLQQLMDLTPLTGMVDAKAIAEAFKNADWGAQQEVENLVRFATGDDAKAALAAMVQLRGIAYTAMQAGGLLRSQKSVLTVEDDGTGRTKSLTHTIGWLGGGAQDAHAKLLTALGSAPSQDVALPPDPAYLPSSQEKRQRNQRALVAPEIQDGQESQTLPEPGIGDRHYLGGTGGPVGPGNGQEGGTGQLQDGGLGTPGNQGDSGGPTLAGLGTPQEDSGVRPTGHHQKPDRQTQARGDRIKHGLHPATATLSGDCERR